MLPGPLPEHGLPITGRGQTKMSAELNSRDKSKVAVIGAGIVGLMSALEVQRTGRHVVVIDPGEPGGRQAASYGNGAWIHPGAIMPVSVPGLWLKVLKFLADKSGPFVIRWRYLPRLMPWLLKFIWAGRNWRLVEDCARVRFELCRRAVTDHQSVAAEAGVGHLIEQKGLLFIYRDKSEFLAESREWTMRRRWGVKINELDRAALLKLEPNVSERYQFAAQVEGAHVTDPNAYCQAIADLIQKRGGEFIHAPATGFQISDGHLEGVKVGDVVIGCDQAIVTAGIGSKKLAAAAGDRVPLESERGYHVVMAGGGNAVTHPMMPSDGKMAITPTRRGLRIAGQVELASVNADPNWDRAEVLRKFGSRVLDLPGLDEKAVDQWMGNRPSTPDGLPCISAARSCCGLFYGFGHGHTGLTQAPATAKLLAALIAGKEPELDVSPMSVLRF